MRHDEAGKGFTIKTTPILSPSLLGIVRLLVLLLILLTGLGELLQLTTTCVRVRCIGLRLFVFVACLLKRLTVAAVDHLAIGVVNRQQATTGGSTAFVPAAVSPAVATTVAATVAGLRVGVDGSWRSVMLLIVRVICKKGTWFISML
jgi:hypothetical protein